MKPLKYWLIDWCLTLFLAVFQLYRGMYKFYINLWMCKQTSTYEIKPLEYTLPPVKWEKKGGGNSTIKPFESVK